MRRILLSLLTILVNLAIMAGNVTEQEALKIAQRFMQDKTFQQKNLRRAPAVGDNQFYVFNAEGQGGFVIVSADDRTIPILGYADEGSLEMDKLPVNARYWLESYAAQIKALGENVKTSTITRRTIGSPVQPLLSCKWDQYTPYNLQCPQIGDEYCVTGCVATAMAQVMYYYRYPNTTSVVIPAYTTETNKLHLDELPATTFKWDKMRDQYNYTSNDEGALAVAELMRYCGQAVQMDYSTNESSASVFASHMTHYFGYSKTTRDVARSNYTSATWEKLIYDELKEARPILYSGQSGAGGHQFVIDGYDDRGLFHVNWGWSGSSDGYFTLSVLNPNDRGAGGGASANGYTMDQWAIIGLKPDQGEQAATSTVYFQSTNSIYEPYTRSSSADNFTNVYADGRIYQWGAVDMTADHAWVLFKDGVQLKTLRTQNVTARSGGWFTTVSAELTFGAGLSDGQYELRQMISAPGANQWELCNDFYRNILIAEINGNTLTLKNSKDITGTVNVNNASLKGKNQVKRPMTITINWTNNGFYNENPFYVWFSNASKYVGAASSYVERGATGDVDIIFTPETAGTTTLYVTTDVDGTNRVYEQEITISEPLPQVLSATIAIEGENAHTIQGSTINATVSFTNEGTNDYDDDVVFYLWPLDHDGYSTGDPIIVTKPLQVAAGAKTDVNVQFTDLSIGNYGLIAYYYAPDFSDAGYTECGVGLLPQNLSGDIEIEGAVGQTLAGTTINATATFTNYGPNDYDDEVLFGLVQIDENGYYVGNPVEIKKPLKLTAGQKGSVTVQFPDLIAGKTYYLYTYYYAPSITYAAATICTVGKVVNPVELEIQATTANATGTKDNGFKTIEGTTAKLNFTVKNTSTYDYNDKVMLVLYEIDDNYASGNYVKTLYLNVQVAAGQTITINDYEISSLEIGKNYFAWLYYFIGTYENWAGNVPAFSMIAPTGIQTITVDKLSNAPVYNLNGQRVSPAHKGLVIRNGKKYINK